MCVHVCDHPYKMMVKPQEVANRSTTRYMGSILTCVFWFHSSGQHATIFLSHFFLFIKRVNMAARIWVNIHLRSGERDVEIDTETCKAGVCYD